MCGKLPLVQSNLPESTMMPPMAVPWPPIHLVVECTTMSAPRRSGCWKYGEAKIEFWHEIEAGFAGRQPIADF